MTDRMTIAKTESTMLQKLISCSSELFLQDRCRGQGSDAESLGRLTKTMLALLLRLASSWRVLRCVPRGVMSRRWIGGGVD